MRISRSIGAAVLATALAFPLAACGADGDPDSGPTSNSPSADSSPSTTSPTVPAGWKAASAKIAQVHVPSDWELDSYADQAQSMIAPEDKVGLSPGSGEIMADVYSTDGDIETELDGLAELHSTQLKSDGSFTKVEHLANETINGSLFYHFRAETEHTWDEMYGTLVPDAGMQVIVEWKFNKSDIDRKDAEALIAPIMATYEVL